MITHHSRRRPECVRMLVLGWLTVGGLLVGDLSPVRGQALPATRPGSTRPGSSGVAAAAKSTLIPLGTTFVRAQAASWVDSDRFAVGRWDGTITVFRTMANKSEFGPMLLSALTTPSRKGVEMVTGLSGGRFVSSNDVQSIIFWWPEGSGFSSRSIPFAPKFGTAVSAARMAIGDQNRLVVGHAQGWITIWAIADAGLADDDATEPASPVLQREVSVRSEDPIPWKWQTWHVRGIAACGSGRMIAVGEDGDICLLDVLSGQVLSRRRYDVAAQRGMNDVAVLGDLVAVVNCAVGRQDHNLRIYRLVGNSLEPVAAERLILDKMLDQVFTFSVELFEFDGLPHFLASTEEGLVWFGNVKDHKIVVLSKIQAAVEGGVVVAVNPANGTVLSVGHRIQTFAIGPRPVPPATTKP